MTVFQILMLVLGAVVVASAFWGNIVALFDRGEKLPVNNVSKLTHGEQCDKVCHKDCDDNCPSNLTEIVSLWEHLKDHCDAQNLTEASAELDKVFPLLVKQSPKVEVKA